MFCTVRLDHALRLFPGERCAPAVPFGLAHHLQSLPQRSDLLEVRFEEPRDIIEPVAAARAHHHPSDAEKVALSLTPLALAC